MKKILLTAGLIVLCIICHAQSAIQEADRAFVAGNYSDAIQLYEMSASTIVGNEGERNRLYASANKCRKLVSLHSKGDRDWQAKDYESAIASYSQILKLNPKDSKAKSRQNEYSKRVRNAQENAAWNKICSEADFSSKALLAKDYVKKYPSGNYIHEAKDIIEEESLWQAAKATNTYSSYSTYIKDSKMQAYLPIAERQIALMDEMLWDTAKRINTKAGYLEYTERQKDKNGKHLEESTCLYNLLNARELFYKKDYSNAYHYYIAAKGYLTSKEDKDNLNRCIHYQHYIEAVSPESTIEDCKNYLSKYQRNYYYSVENNKVQDRIRELLCKAGRFDEAMKYSPYKSHVKYVKKAKKAWKKAHR